MKMEPNILFVADVPLENPVSGSEQVLFQQACGLAKLGFKIKALTRQNGHMPNVRRKAYEGIEERRYSAPPENSLRFIYASLKNSFKLFESISQSEIFQIAVCHHPFTYSSLLSTGRLRNIPKIHVFHSPTHLEYKLLRENKNAMVNFLPIKARFWVEKFCHCKASKVMVLSQYMKRLVHELYNIPKEKITVNPGGVDIDHFKRFTDRQKLKREVGFSRGKSHLLTIRNHELRMGLDNLVRAADLLRKKKIEFHLIIGGDGPEKGKITNLINDYQLNDVVMLVGFIPPEKLPKYYAAADFFILPTRKLEGFGLVTPESMACGTPVLGTPVGGTKEILSPFNSQLLFTNTSPEAMASGIEEAIISKFNDQNDYEILREKCREYVEKNYSWQRHVEQLQSIIMRTMNTYSKLRN